MKKSWAMKWAKALESGKYRQTRGRLKGKFGYCCLGVLCDISKVGKWENDSYLGYNDNLPNEVESLTGIKDKWPGEILNLVRLNDISKKSFKEIAKVIRKYWKEL